MLKVNFRGCDIVWPLLSLMFNGFNKMVNFSMKFMRRFASSWAKTSNATVIEEGSFFGHVHMAKEIWPFNEFGNDGTGGRETEATVQCKRLDGGNLENCRNENITIASKFRTRTSCTSSVTAFRST